MFVFKENSAAFSLRLLGVFSAKSQPIPAGKHRGATPQHVHRDTAGRQQKSRQLHRTKLATKTEGGTNRLRAAGS